MGGHFKLEAQNLHVTVGKYLLSITNWTPKHKTQNNMEIDVVGDML